MKKLFVKGGAHIFANQQVPPSLSLEKAAPYSRTVQPIVRVVAIPQVGVLLHHRYERSICLPTIAAKFRVLRRACDLNVYQRARSLFGEKGIDGF
jgi:hypothetical protein